MGFLQDTFLGQRPDLALPPGMQEYLDLILKSGKVGLGRVGKDAKHDRKMLNQGRIEDTNRARPILTAIGANKASSLAAADRSVRSATAFEQNPASYTSALLGEVGGQLDQNAGVAFAGAMADVYDDTGEDIESARRYKHGCMRTRQRRRRACSAPVSTTGTGKGAC